MLEIGTQQEPLVNLRGIGTIREVERRERDLKILGEDHPLRRPVLLCLKDNPKERPKASDLQRDVLAMVNGESEVYDSNYLSLVHACVFCMSHIVFLLLYLCTFRESTIWRASLLQYLMVVHSTTMSLTQAYLSNKVIFLQANIT